MLHVLVWIVFILVLFALISSVWINVLVRVGAPRKPVVRCNVIPIDSCRSRKAAHSAYRAR